MRERVRIARGRSERIKGEGKAYRCFTKISYVLNVLRLGVLSLVGMVMIAIVMLPTDAFGAGILESSPLQVKSGTLPLLAALAIGIAVAVGAVIAFLQLTAKGREANDYSFVMGQDNEQLEGPISDVWDDEASPMNSGYDDNLLTDYTIPVTGLLRYPDHVETASDAEPRICGVEGEHSGSCYRILDRILSFGRDPAKCSILFPYEAAQISRLHCSLSYMEDSHTFMLEDHGSSNGTFLADGQRLEPGRSYELHAGQRFSLSGGEHWFEVKDGK